MEIGEKFLPIGTVVLLKNGKRELMITSYCVMPAGDVYDKTGKIEAKGQMFDYGACLYPEGLISSDQIFVFNHEQIERICFKGYETDKQKEFSKLLKRGTEEQKVKDGMEKTIEVINNNGTESSLTNEETPSNQ